MTIAEITDIQLYKYSVDACTAEFLLSLWRSHWNVESEMTWATNSGSVPATML